MELSEGAIQSILDGQEVEKPILQILGQKRLLGSGNQERYRLLVSDGRTLHSFAMLATQLNNKIDSGELDTNAVVRLDRYICNTVQNGKKVMVILDLSVLSRGTDVGGKIGNPVNPGDARPMAPAPTAPPARPAGAGPSYRPPPVMSGGVSARPPLVNRPTMTNTRTAASTGGLGPGTQTHPISSLTPYQNKWVVKARVTNKSNIRTWSNARGEGKLFSMDLTDESGEIRATAFNQQCDKFYDMIEINKVYYITRGTLKPANKQFTSIKNDHEMTFNNDTQVTPCYEDSASIPSVTYNFVSISQLEQVEKDTLVDVIGVCRSCSDVQNIVSRTTNREFTKRDIELVDMTNTEVRVTLWSSQAEQFDASNQPVVAVKGAKVSDFGGRSLSLVSSSLLQINPEVQEAYKLRGWYDNEGVNLQPQSLSSGGAGASGGFASNWKTFGEIQAEQLGMGDKGDYTTSKATVIMIRKERALYKACMTEGCNKKVIDNGDSTYRCEKCNKELHDFKWRLILSVNLGDCTGNQWVTCFQETGEVLLGHTADEVGELFEKNEEAFQAIIQKAMFKSYIFKLRSKMEKYNDESRLKSVVMSATPMDWSTYAQKLESDIQQLGGTLPAK